MLVWQRLRDILDGHGRAALVTVAATRGSSPREAGARMILTPEGSFTGTIGGGTLEWRAIAMAQARLAREPEARAEVKSFVLGPDMGQCCGGQVDLLFEVMDDRDRATVDDLAVREAAGPFVTAGRIARTGVMREVAEEAMAPGNAELAGGILTEGFGDARRPLLLFGAGHVGRALVLALAPLPFAVDWIDPRADAFPAHVPANVKLVRASDPVDAVRSAPAGAFVLIMSHSHQLDLALCAAALADDRFPYVGLIGSKSKRARFASQLAAAGIPRARIDAMVCPIGIDGIEGKSPAIIAAATAAELLIRDEAVASGAVEVPPLRGGGEGPPPGSGQGPARGQAPAVEGAGKMRRRGP
jgi:xanthine dehydrogenase accessory factor